MTLYHNFPLQEFASFDQVVHMLRLGDWFNCMWNLNLQTSIEATLLQGPFKDWESFQGGWPIGWIQLGK